MVNVRLNRLRQDLHRPRGRSPRHVRPADFPPHQHDDPRICGDQPSCGHQPWRRRRHLLHTTSPTKWRAHRIYVNEPNTLEWIANFSADDVLFDNGANVGTYSIWAAKTRGTRVYAFEPELQNYEILNKNILVNGLTDRVTAYCLAISNSPRFSELNL